MQHVSRCSQYTTHKPEKSFYFYFSPRHFYNNSCKSVLEIRAKYHLFLTSLTSPSQHHPFQSFSRRILSSLDIYWLILTKMGSWATGSVFYDADCHQSPWICPEPKQGGVCTASTLLLLVHPLVLWMSSAVKCSRPTNMCFSSAAREAGALRVTLDEVTVLINKSLSTREMQLPGPCSCPASSWENSN